MASVPLKIGTARRYTDVDRIWQRKQVSVSGRGSAIIQVKGRG
jgi:hypothetical protein